MLLIQNYKKCFLLQSRLICESSSLERTFTELRDLSHPHHTFMSLQSSFCTQSIYLFIYKAAKASSCQNTPEIFENRRKVKTQFAKKYKVQPISAFRKATLSSVSVGASPVETNLYLHINSWIWKKVPKTVSRLLVFTHWRPGQPGPVTRHPVPSAERPVLLLSKVSHQQGPLCGLRQRDADGSTALSHYGAQTAEDRRSGLQALLVGYQPLKVLLTMTRPF